MPAMDGPAAAPTAISLRSVKLKFGEEEILANVGFEVRQGSFVCLVGPSGCGKSTTLRIIGGLLQATKGQVDVYNEAPSVSWRRLAYVFQAPRLVPWRTALENVVLGMQLRETKLAASETRQRALQNLEMVGLLPEADKFPGMLSGGQKQRVALARALAVDPDIILMDEPFTALDFTTRKSLRDHLIRIWQQTGKTILFVTHDLEEALYLADTIIVFSTKPTRIERTIELDRPRPRNVASDPVLAGLDAELRRSFVDIGDRPTDGEAAATTEGTVEGASWKSGFKGNLVQRLVADGFIVAAFLGWYFYSKMVPEFIVPDPFKVLRITGELFYSPRYALHTYTSLLRVVASVALSLLISGVIVGAGWYFRPLRLLVANRLIPILNAFPSLGWAMLAVIWFGVNTTSVMFVEIAILLPFSMISLWEGVKSLDAETLEMARSFTKGRFNILRRVILPLLFPFIFSAIRMSYGVAWKVALIAELFGGDVGLGHLLNIASQELDTALVFAIIVALIILVIGVERLIFDQFEKRAQRQRFA
jgi:NitT/TauT family transport system ATP-binding protein